MAIRTAVMDNARQGSWSGDGAVKRIAWYGLIPTGPDSGTPIALSEFSIACIHFGCSNLATGVASSLGTGDTFVLQGSNDYIPAAEDGGNPINAGTWAPLKDISNTAISTAALNAVFQLGQRPLWIRPIATAGSAGGSWNIVLVAYRGQPMIIGG